MSASASMDDAAAGIRTSTAATANRRTTTFILTVAVLGFVLFFENWSTFRPQQLESLSHSHTEGMYRRAVLVRTVQQTQHEL